MGFTGALLGGLKGFDQAVGASGAAQDVQKVQDQKAQEKQQKVQMQLAPLHMASVALQSQLAPLIDPQTGKPRPESETRYNEIHDQLADVIGKQRMILNPPPKEDPHGLGHLVHAATDKLHITNHAVQQAREANTKKVNDYYQQGIDQVNQTVQGVVPSQLNPAETHKAALINAKLEPGASTAKPAMANFRGPNGDLILRDKNAPETIPEGYVLAGTSSAAAGLKPIASGGVTIGVTANGKPYFAKDVNNPDTPPEVKSFFSALDEGQKARIAQKEKDRQEQYAEMEKRQRISIANANQRAIYQFQNALSMNQARPAEALLTKQQAQYFSAADLQKKMQSLMPEALGGNQQAMVAILADHIAMTTHQPGASMRPTKALFDEAAASQPWMQSITKKFDDQGILTGVVLSPEQIQNMVDLAPMMTAAEKSTLDQMQQATGGTINPTPAQLQPPAGPKTNSLKTPGAAEFIYAKDPQGKVHRAKKGTKLPQGWTLTNGPS